MIRICEHLPLVHFSPNHRILKVHDSYLQLQKEYNLWIYIFKIQYLREWYIRYNQHKEVEMPLKAFNKGVRSCLPSVDMLLQLLN